MSMSTHIEGIVPPDENWKKMKGVYDACSDAGIPIPKEVEKFFEYGEPDPAGMVIEIKPRKVSWKGCGDGFEIDVNDLPDKVKTIRFVNSY